MPINIETFYKDHWETVEPERFAVYEKIFKYSPGHEPLLAPAGFAPGQTVVDFGCGPGGMVVELARRVGPDGRVHGVDINPDFVERARARTAEEQVADRVEIHHMTDARIPLNNGTVDRVLCKNVLEYVDDPLATLTEIRRVLKPGGKVHATDSDWGFLVAEPLTAAEISELISAAHHAFKTPQIGRQLYGLCRKAGYSDVSVVMHGVADVTGMRAGILKNMATYARQGGSLPESRIDALVEKIDLGVENDTYLFVLPQFLVTGTV